MKEYYDKFNQLLDAENRYECIKYIRNLVQNKSISIVEAYEQILGPSLNNTGKSIIEEKERIWEEHVKTSIVRSVVECLYPNVYENIHKKTGLKALVLCPSEEFHEIGARMVSDFLLLLGYDVTYIGGNTPIDDFVYAINELKPALVAISVTNYYNLVVLKDTIEKVREIDQDCKILVGGGAFGKNNCHTTVGADYCAHTFAEIELFVGEINAGV